MGSRIARLVRNVNLENRVEREISKKKPKAAPRHVIASDPSLGVRPRVDPRGVSTTTIHQKSDPLLKHLKAVYVDSTDPEEVKPAPESEVRLAPGSEVRPAPESETSVQDVAGERRPLRFSLPWANFGQVEITDVPKGKLTMPEALKALNNHQQQPQTWTPQKIAEEYTLDLKDTQAVLKFFMPFQVYVLKPMDGKTKQIKDS